MPKKLSNSFQLTSAVGRHITVHHYAAATPQKVVIMAPAMAVPHSFYRGYCQWLADQGYHVIGFDYYGIGASGEGSVKARNSSITEWAQQDAQAVLNHALDTYPELPTVWFAHSIGGQIFGLLERHQDVERMVTVATGTGFWRDTQPKLKFTSWLLWRGIVPWLVPLAGYFPGQRLGMIGDVPKQAMLQWRRWCLHPDYVVGAENAYQRYAAIRTPIISLSFSDDELLTARNIQAMHDFYENAPQQRIEVTPAQFELPRLGHFDIFRAQAEPLWRELFVPQLEAPLPQ